MGHNTMKVIDAIEILQSLLPEAYRGDWGIVEGSFQNGRNWMFSDQKDETAYPIPPHSELPKILYLEVYAAKTEDSDGLAFNEQIYDLPDTDIYTVIKALVMANYGDYSLFS